MIDKRMLYSQGQRVTKTLDGSRPGYRGSDWGDQAYSRGAYSNPSPSTSSYNPGAGGVVDHSPPNTGSASTEDRSSGLQTYNTKKATGRLGRQDANQKDSTIFYGPKGETIDIGYQGTLNPREQLNYDLLNTPYKPVNLPPYIPGSTLINMAGNFLAGGNKRNRQFFVDNVSGKHGYGYGLDEYKRYMKDRMSGKVGAYGNEEQGFNALNRSGRDDGIMGITDGTVGVTFDNITDGTTDDDTTTTDDELILRFLGADSTLDPAAAGLGSTDELRAMLLERAKNLYT